MTSDNNQGRECSANTDFNWFFSKNNTKSTLFKVQKVHFR